MEPRAAADEISHVPARQVILSAVAVWLCYFLLVTLRSAVVDTGSVPELLWPRAVVTLAGIAVTLLAWPLLRPFEGRALPIRVGAALVAMLPAALLLAAVNQQAFAAIEQRMIEEIARKAERTGADGRAGETIEAGGVRIHHDYSGNVLIDVPDPVPPAPPMPPLPGGVEAPTPPTPPSPTAAERPGIVIRRTGGATDSSVQVATPAAGKAAQISAALDHDGLWRQLTDVALGRYFLLIAWAALYLALGNAEQVRAAERRAGEYRRAAKAAELRSLRYQVNPHFLFNTLNSLSALVMVGRTAQAEQMIQAMSNFYRHSLAGDPSADIPLGDEVALQRHYLEIEAVRFPERLRVAIDVPAELESLPVPGMILQPLIENAVKYGVAGTARPVTVSLAARRDGDRLILTVADDAPPGAGGGAKAGLGIGLTNVRDRLKARFGDAAGLQTGPVAGGYRTELVIPLRQPSPTAAPRSHEA